MEKHDYQVKDVKQDAKKELRVHVAYSKFKRARGIVLDTYLTTFICKYSELEAYANELMRSNPEVQFR